MPAADMPLLLLPFPLSTKASSASASKGHQLKWAGMAKERQTSRPTMKNKEPLL
jgi:hypothetical protein